MLFNSYGFIFLFLPIVLIGYVTIGRYLNQRVAIVWIVLSSLFFYGWWNPAYLGLILGSMFFNYFLGLRLQSVKALSTKKILLLLGITVNLSLLAYFKYANFFVDNINVMFSIGWNLENIILPLAISFFTFQQITYLVDTYRGEIEEYSFLHYALFVTFFPQLIAGPIVHHSEMMPQFDKLDLKKYDYGFLAVGLTLFFFGLFKKVVIADSLSPYVLETYQAVSQGEILSLFEAWRGAFAYTFQLYFDFSGYSDMAIGLAFLFGIRLPLNFNSPYKASSIIDFWRRWHMTLSRFLRDYLYIPLGGNRKGVVRRYINLMITMLLGGLWHGAGWTFVVWGGLHGIYLIINHQWRNILDHFSLSTGPVMRVLYRLLTFLSVMVAWVYFRAGNLDEAHLMLLGMVGEGGVIWPEEAKAQLGVFADIFQSWGMRFQYLEYFNGKDHVILMSVLLMIVWFMPNIQQLFNIKPAIIDVIEGSSLQWRPNKRWLFLTVVVAVLSILKLGQVSEFLYFQF